MVVAEIIAGGSGQRMGQDIPKQFINVFDKPLLMYTLEIFQNHPLIDMIEVVCIDGWQDVVWAYANHYGITKLRWIVTGGNTGQESIRNGIFHLEQELEAKDIVVIHDGIRPLVEEYVLSSVIETATKYGNGITSRPYNEQVFMIDEEDKESTKRYIHRRQLRRVSTPQAYQFGILDSVYHDAFNQNKGIGPSTYTNTLMVDFGYSLYFAEGSDRNIKITTIDDLEIFKAYIKSGKNK